ncbi:MAG: GTPase ObgE [Candidatus Ryanbacteria bacterium CG10_big_fil_rev_8_21_14_0_10_43_42]|uniref:GTPase Obg n=1 Tax=Candidatus Ryanbacteria bacterium CG10_big_fil_rev_8_21_14_0_10_43_42 TaxID=1974864 RepID=A0A2M8KW11_9BACT|nr:MAG: GTPase ObgE [Candidatus Ryanbacteria bacterium CG10_big_fil_rev_8_21_14_0_10_43_42]
MAFVDEIDIYARAGDGGNGVVRWRRMRNIEFGGPSGGDGGRGGAVYLRAVRDVHLLSKYRVKKEFIAKRGQDGGSDSLEGKNGEDLYIDLPIGSVVTNVETQKNISLLHEGEEVLLLEGGNGGRGNESFKSSRNQRPRQATRGRAGEEGFYHIELELIADIGLIGLPNAGKTSLLNEFTNAHAKVGAYPFTTLEPNLGECYGYIIADVPGLIEGAAEGRGLGHKFLRHVKRLSVLVHLISLENKDPVKTYATVRNELAEYDSDLLKKKEIIVLTKTDILSDRKEVEKIMTKMKKISPLVYTVSVYDDASLKALNDILLQEVKTAIDAS